MTTKETWQPSASIDHLKKRAEILNQIRDFFRQRAYLEVETPAMGHYAVSDIYLSNIEARFRQHSYYLQTSPEYHMKRLLAAGSGPIFQIARVFRDDELGRWHNPEFSMLEWYQLDIDHHQLMLEVNDLLQKVLNCPAMIKKSYQQVFIDICNLDPFAACLDDLRGQLSFYDLENVLPEDEKDPDQYLFLLMSHVIEPALAKENAPVAVHDFPVSQAALAKIKDNRAQRFEVYYQGLELANGFHELSDASLQEKRFEQDNQQRRRLALPEKQADQHFLQALRQGLPECSGVALGIDRLLALALSSADISSVMAFDFIRA